MANMQQLEFKVEQLCCANAYRDEQFENFRYGKRHDQICDHIIKSRNENIDVISIKESRQCKDKDGNIKQPLWFIADICEKSGYSLGGFDRVKNHQTEGMPSYTPFHLCQLYDDKKLIKIQSHAFWYYPELFGKFDPPHLGGMILAVLYEIINMPDNFILVESFHLPLQEQLKTQASEWIKNKYPIERNKVFGDIQNIVRSGDFNTFKDKETWKYQYECFSHDMIPATEKMFDENTGNQLYGTFYPFPHDFCVPITLPNEEGTNHSVTDYMFCQGNIKPIKCALTWNGLDLRLSDHLPMKTTFEIHN